MILPIQNLGEIALILQKAKEAFTLLDMSLKLYKQLDPDNLLKYKNLALLASLMDQQGQTQTMQMIFKSIFTALEQFEAKELEDEENPQGLCYERVFALRNYGFLLAKNDETRLEGNDYIKQAEVL